MTHYEVRAAIERLDNLNFDEMLTTHDVNRALMGKKVDEYGAYEDAPELCVMLVALLRQADPDTHMILPVDADGVPIRIGDRMVEHEDGHEFEFVVDGYEYDGDEWQVFQRDSIRAPEHMCTHYHEPTVEDVLREFAERVIDSQIPALSHTYEETIAEYASRLALKDEAMATSEGLES